MVSSEDEKSPLGRPQIRWTDLNSNSTVYDKLVAAPSDNDLRLMWTLSSIMDFIVSAFIATVILAILLDHKTRRNPFDLFLIFVLLPDLWFSFQCLLTCTLNSIAHHYYSAAMCRWQGFYVVFNIAANSWLNAIIAHEVHYMLRSSFIRKRYFPPKRCYIVKISFCTYAWSGLLAFWSIATIEKLPQHFDAHFGFVCLPVGSTEHCRVFMWTCFFPLLFGIPYLYVMWISLDVFVIGRLLPTRGRRRTLALYLVRIIFVFLVMWLPSLTVFFAMRGQVSPWVKWSFAMWAHAQGVVSAGITLTKKEVRRAARRLITLRWCVTGADDGIDLPQSSTLGSGFSSWIPKAKSQSPQNVLSDATARRIKSSTAWQHGRDEPTCFEQGGNEEASRVQHSQGESLEVLASSTTMLSGDESAKVKIAEAALEVPMGITRAAEPSLAQSGQSVVADQDHFETR